MAPTNGSYHASCLKCHAQTLFPAIPMVIGDTGQKRREDDFNWHQNRLGLRDRARLPLEMVAGSLSERL